MENSRYTALSSNTRPNKDLISFITNNLPDTGKTILDWGAGKGRHSKQLRDLGYKVWSYDPYNGEDTLDGYNKVSKNLPNENYDLVFSAYVLNVIPKKNLNNAIKEIESFGKDDSIIIHKVREDIDLVKKAVLEKDYTVKGKKGSIQRLVLHKDLINYDRSKKNKLYFRKVKK
tara:strand:- start:105 stop:623 length:519 start_codon:yes stop_codon:yes gene_type:complete